MRIMQEEEEEEMKETHVLNVINLIPTGAGTGVAHAVESGTRRHALFSQDK